jgi:hypothetical protein
MRLTGILSQCKWCPWRGWIHWRTNAASDWRWKKCGSIIIDISPNKLKHRHFLGAPCEMLAIWQYRDLSSHPISLVHNWFSTNSAPIIYIVSPWDTAIYSDSVRSWLAIPNRDWIVSLRLWFQHLLWVAHFLCARRDATSTLMLSHVTWSSVGSYHSIALNLGLRE